MPYIPHTSSNWNSRVHKIGHNSRAKLKTQGLGKNSKLEQKLKTQGFGKTKNAVCRKSVEKKAALSRIALPGMSKALQRRPEERQSTVFVIVKNLGLYEVQGNKFSVREKTLQVMN